MVLAEVTTMSIRYFSNPRRNFRASTPTAAALLLLTASAWSRPAFCGPIHDAAKTGDLAKIRSLLQADPSLVNTQDDDGVTPLIYATHFAKPEAAKLLLEKGAAANTPAGSGITALYEASGHGMVDVVKMLLAKGATVDAKTTAGGTPLLLAAENGQLEVVKLLLAKGADVNVQASYSGIHWSNTPLIGATKVKADYDFIVRNGGVEPLGGTRVPIANRTHGYFEVVKALLEKGAKTDARDNWDCTALSYASSNWQSEVVKLLLDNGAEVDARDNNGATPLLKAAQHGDVETVRILLAKGADPNAEIKAGVSSKQWTPLTIAEANNFTEVVGLLRQAAKH